MDNLYKETAKEVFAKKGLTADFESKYPKLKDQLMSESRSAVEGVFNWMETTEKSSIDAARGSKEFEKNKALYVKYFRVEIAETLSRNEHLLQFFHFNNSDRITYFKSNVTVKPDGVLLVKEDISIYNGNGTNGAGTNYNNYNTAEDAGSINDEIKRGIIRNFPTQYVGDYKLNNNTTFKLLSVLVNSEKATYKSERHDNGIAVRIGEADRELETGNFTYTITYETKYQIKHLDNSDQLVWNVTGNGWNFRIDSAACTIQLPNGASIISNNCVTGAQDTRGTNCEVFYNKNNDSLTAVFKTNRPLSPYEGLTVATSWNKGAIAATSTPEKYLKLLKDNQLVFLFPILALLLIFYNSYAWKKVGKDPEPGNIIPTFYPPANLSPAAMGFILNQAFGNRFVSATMVDLAVRNKLVIDVEKEGIIFKDNIYNIKSSSKPEIKVAYEDYGQSAKALIGDTIKKGKYNSTLATLSKEIAADCDKKYHDKKSGFFALNNWYMAPGNILIVLLFLYLKIFVFNFSTVIKYNPVQLGYAIGGLILCIIVQVFFYTIMPAYTIAGRKIMDEIEGFRMYLKAADEQRINAMNPPEKSLELYERYMPFAIALACENEWGDQFSAIIAQATVNAKASGSYASGLYSSNFYAGAFTSAFVSSFSGSISSASTPPSSSGSSGGFSSGGGGGGGGGGGW